jgi:hypothetical protein
MVTASLISRLSHAVDEIENRLKQNRPRKIVKVRRGFKEGAGVARLTTMRPIPRFGAQIS